VGYTVADSLESWCDHSVQQSPGALEVVLPGSKGVTAGDPAVEHGTPAVRRRNCAGDRAGSRPVPHSRPPQLGRGQDAPTASGGSTPRAREQPSLSRVPAPPAQPQGGPGVPPVVGRHCQVATSRLRPALLAEVTASRRAARSAPAGGGDTVLHCFVHDLYDGQRMRPDKLEAWRALRERYGNRDESTVDQGTLVAPAT
jgi:hypothetical protein